MNRTLFDASLTPFLWLKRQNMQLALSLHTESLYKICLKLPGIEQNFQTHEIWTQAQRESGLLAQSSNTISLDEEENFRKQSCKSAILEIYSFTCIKPWSSKYFGRFAKEVQFMDNS